MPDGIEELDWCFGGCSQLESIQIPDSVSVIGERTFSGCTALTRIVLPQTLITIGKEVFANCSKRLQIHCSDKIFNKLDKETRDNLALQWLSGQCTYAQPQEQAIKKHINRAAERLFDGFSTDDAVALTELLCYANIKLEVLENWISKCNDNNYPNMLAVLLDYKNANFTAEVVEKHETEKLEKTLGIKERTLAEWKKIFKFVKDADGIRITGYKSLEPVAEIPAQLDGMPVKYIGDKAFRRLSHITTVLIPDSVVSIGKTVFGECTALREIFIPDSVDTIDNCAFTGCKNLEQVSLPQKLKKIGWDMFSGCEKLQALAIPDGVQEIAQCAFSHCDSLTELVLPKGVKKIGNFAFSSTEKLKSVTIPETVSKIGTSAFEGCRALECLVIPAKVKTLGYGTLFGCPQLKKVVIQSAQTVLERGVIDNRYGVVIHAPAGSYAETYAKENNIPFVAE